MKTADKNKMRHQKERRICRLYAEKVMDRTPTEMLTNAPS
jgi:hypothetical protein